MAQVTMHSNDAKQSEAAICFTADLGSLVYGQEWWCYEGWFTF